MTYPEALQYLTDLEPRGWRLGLERMQAFVERAGLLDSLGAPPGPQYVHVAGTNGKGSVTAFVQSMLLSAGFHTGAFFSPYVVDPRERVWFGREMISKDDFTEAIQRLKLISESLDDTEFSGVTEFEMKTAVGFEHWKCSRAEWVALEVGLGGRFDATNVVSPRVSVIVSIGMDHVAILGDTLAKIAFEKAGIIKPGIPVVLGEIPEEAKSVILEIAHASGSEVWALGSELLLEPLCEGRWDLQTPRSKVQLHPSLYGGIQGHNAALAYAAIELSGAASGQNVADGAEAATIPGRFQRKRFRERQFVFDGAHNAEAAAQLRQSLEAFANTQRLSKIVFVSGMVGGHEPASFFKVFEGLVDEVLLAPIQYHRAMPPDDIRAGILDHFREVLTYPNLGAAIEAAIRSTSESDLIVVTGSFYLVGDAIRFVEESLTPS
jgi:dihydrofolate synthase/folylpolyglutamate synthase